MSTRRLPPSAPPPAPRVNRTETADPPAIERTRGPAEPTPLDRPFEPAKPSTFVRPTGLGAFVQGLLDFIRKPVAAGAVVLATSLPILSGCSIGTSTTRPDPSITLLQSDSTDATARRALADAQPVDLNHPYAQHVRALRAELAKDGLPTRADGVRVWVVGSGAGGGQAVRTVASESVGLAPGANVALITGRSFFSDDHKAIDKSVGDGLRAVRNGAEPTRDLMIDLARLEHLDRAGELRYIRESKPSGTQIVTLSPTQSPRALARRLMAELSLAPDGSKAQKYLAGLGNDDGERIKKLTREVTEALESSKGTRLIGSASWTFGREITKGRESGLLTFAAAGDEHDEDEGRKTYSAPLADGTEGLAIVGATELHDPKTPKDDTVLASSGKAWVTLSAPGAEIPVGGLADARDQSGTRLASAYAAATAALMLAENPKLDPDQLEQLLLADGVTHDIQPGVRDGAGVLDPVAAVRVARSAREGRFVFADADHFATAKLTRVHAGPSDDDPYLAHVEDLRDKLIAKGLPTRAPHVKVFVIEPGWDTHAGAVLRTVIDPKIGIAPGADAIYLSIDGAYNAKGEAVEARIGPTRAKIREGTDPFTTDYALDAAEMALYGRAYDIQQIRGHHDGKSTVVVNMSYGTTAFTIAERMIASMDEAPKDSPAGKYLASLPEDSDARLRKVAERVHTILTKPESIARLQPARDALSFELAEARKARIVPITSAGNSRDDEMPDIGASRHIEDNFKDLIVVGATKLEDPRDLDDDVIVPWSSEGHITVAAPGWELPVGLYGDMSGTSFASPYTTGAAALMIEANPDITPDRIEAILRKTGHDIKGDRDGSGVVDVALAVELAKADRKN